MTETTRMFTKAKPGWGTPVHATADGDIHNTLCGYSLANPVATELHADTPTYRWPGHPCGACGNMGGFERIVIWAPRT